MLLEFDRNEENRIVAADGNVSVWRRMDGWMDGGHREQGTKEKKKKG